MYGIKAIIWPIEYELHTSLRIAVAQRLGVSYSLVDWLEWLEGIGEARRASIQYNKAVQIRRKALFDKKQI